MDREAAQQFLPRITSMMRDGGAILAIFHTRPPEQFQRYRVLDAHNLALVSVPTLVRPRHVYQNREIQELFEVPHLKDFCKPRSTTRRRFRQIRLRPETGAPSAFWSAF